MDPKSSHYIPTLDGWRAIAIAGVILSHSFPSNYPTRHGALGVNLFFAISGYLITTRLLAERSRVGAISLREFYIRRGFRILPPALTYLACVAALTLAGVIYSSWTDIASCLVFARNYWGADAHSGWYTGHFWSLAVEEQFYLLWPAVLVFARLRRARWIAPLLALAFSIWRALDLRHGWVADLLHNEALRNYPLRSDYRMDALLWGCTLALLADRVNIRRWVSRGVASALAPAAIVGVVALNIAQPQGYMIGLSLLLPLTLAATVFRPESWLGQLLEVPAMRWVGRLSYSLYLWQQLFVSQYHHGALQCFPVNLILACACAYASYYAVERPMIRLGQRLLTPRRSSEIPVRALAAAA